MTPVKPAAYVILDGSIDDGQRFTVLGVAGELHDEIRRLTEALEVAKGHLRWLMQGHPDPKRRVFSVTGSTHRARLRPKHELHCAIHRCAFAKCMAAHGSDNTRIIVPAEVERYLHIARISDDEGISDVPF